MIQIQRATTEQLRLAHQWTHLNPKTKDWFAYQGGQQELDEFLGEQTRPNYHQFAVMNDEQFAALVTYIEYQPDSFLIDVTAPPGSISKEELARAIYSIGCAIFDAGAKRCECWGLKINRYTRKLALLCGLRADGMVCYSGTHRGKLVQSIRYSVSRNEHYNQREQNDVSI